ncbi:hypothetical protein [Ralstonia phage RSP15]|uniref:hypothetical protein n=1 Tax=Ralstonia phage RSP15 TaxID=1785960 RepID=UPI00074D2936|nr:hypothetical protein BH754_gp170 [Ralstonia phage RSP15]BAU40136.1 hypothetical protein [Ralstonia phage RSP15]
MGRNIMLPDFDKLEDDLDAVETKDETAEGQEPDLYVETCPKCLGSGSYKGYSSYGYQCFKCKGTGKLIFKTSPEQRASARKSAKKSKEKQKTDKLEAFKKEHPLIAEWFEGSDFPFAVSLREAVMKYGTLTENQANAAYRCIDKLDQAKKAAEDRKKNALSVDISEIKKVFDTALSKGYKKPGLRLAGFKFSPAPATGKNGGAVYVKSLESGEYMGKVMNGKFFKTRECSEDAEEAIVQAASDPKNAAISFGRLTGVCACCGRELTDKESVALGIGPICAEKYGW